MSRLVLLVALLVVPSTAQAATVDVGGFSFMPDAVTVQTGQQVTWNWVGPDRNHTVTADPGQAESFESHPGVPTAAVADGPPGESFSHTFTHVGMFSYVCRVHSNMQGKVTVVPAGGSPPDTTPPTAALRVLSKSLPKVLRSHKLRVRVAVNEGATVKLRVKLGTRALAKKTVEFATGGRKTVALRLGRKARAKLADDERARIAVSARAEDAAGNVDRVKKRKTLS